LIATIKQTRQQSNKLAKTVRTVVIVIIGCAVGEKKQVTSVRMVVAF
jgi:hypothetical protein